MKIAIIGAGWVGCHLAHKLGSQHQIDMYEKNGIFSGTSLLNQNRLHIGYHYARNSMTRNMCRQTFETFMKDYGKLVSDIEKNIYCVPNKDSLIDFDTYIKIFDEYDAELVDFSYLKNIDGAIRVDEKYIDPHKASSFFHEIIGNRVILSGVEKQDIKKISIDYDLVINCTNNQLLPITDETFEEPCDIFVYEKKREAPFDALTLVDGNLFSIFPYIDNTFTVTDVEYTPNNSLSVLDKKTLIEEKIMIYYPDFLDTFSFSYPLRSLKIKNKNMSANRYPTISRVDNVISCFTGKIQGVYAIEEYVRNYISEVEN